MRARSLRLLRYALTRSPRSVLRRANREMRHLWVRREDQAVLGRLASGALFAELGEHDVDRLWQELSARPFVAETGPANRERCELVAPGEPSRVLRAAEMALARRVDLLGSGEVYVGKPVEWSRDHKTGLSWGYSYAPHTDYAELQRPSDVKFPWELSRLQWLLPAGLAYRLEADERYARGVRDLIDDWIVANPFARTVNWAIAMEAALRTVTWTWFFHVFARTSAWSDTTFRRRFLTMLYAHGDFVERHIERSDVNGNHFTADAAGLLFVGLFFGDRGRGPRWREAGWAMLSEELPRQVTLDGVDFECSTAYHRLVAELFTLSALYRKRTGLSVDTAVRERLIRMGEFAAAYCRADGSVPLWGDADDGRVLPLGSQSVNDHRYLPELIGRALEEPNLAIPSNDNRSECFWLLGDAPPRADRLAELRSQAFPVGGVYIMRNDRDHVFVDCGPVGMAGRGGHGHNDCLSFEAVLDGTLVVSDSGTFVYTASPAWRNTLRSTAAHNTPMIDDQELNRFVHPDFLWLLMNDAVPEVVEWAPQAVRDALTARHTGYSRLAAPVTVQRAMVLEHETHRLLVHDRFEGVGEHYVQDPLHLAPGVEIVRIQQDHCELHASGRTFVVRWNPITSWMADQAEYWNSPSYGRRVRGSCLRFTRRGPLCDLAFVIAPSTHDSRSWLLEHARVNET